MSRVDINSVMLSGNVLKDAFVSPTGKVVKFTVVNHNGDNKESYIPCQAFGSKLVAQAERLQKGDHVVLGGRMNQSSYKKGEQTINVVELTVEIICVSIASEQQDDELFPGDNAAKQEGYSALE